MEELLREFIFSILDESEAEELCKNLIECGKFIMKKYPNRIALLSEEIQNELFEMMIQTNYKLIYHYHNLSDKQIFRVLNIHPDAILHLRKVPTEEMLLYVLSRDQSLANKISCQHFPDNLIEIVAEYEPSARVFLENMSIDEQFYFVEKSLHNIIHIKNPCQSVCNYVLDRNPNIILSRYNCQRVCEYIFEYDIKFFVHLIHQTEQMVDRVIKERPDLAIHINAPLCQDFCDNMLDSHGIFIRKINNPTKEQCIRAFPTYHAAVLFMKDPPYDMLIKAIDSDVTIFYCLKTFDEVIVWYVIHNYPEILKFYHESMEFDEPIKFTYEQFEYIALRYPKILSYIKNLPIDICYLLIDNYKSDAIEYILDPCPEIIKALIETGIENIGSLCHVKHKNIILHLLLKDPHLIKHFDHQTTDIIYLSILLDPETQKYIKVKNSNINKVINGERLDCFIYRTIVNFIKEFS